MGTQTIQSAPPISMQGIAIPAESVNPDEFRAKTRRHTQQEGVKNYTTGDTGETFQLRKSDILAGLTIRFSGQIVVTPGSGSVASTARWPYDFIKAAKFTANGASNLINVSGLKLKARDMMKHGDQTDRGVSQIIGGVARTQGTLAKAFESWGVGSATTGLTAGTYPIELEWNVPVCEDMKDLVGAIFLATATADLTLALEYEQIANLFNPTGNGAVAITGKFQVTSHKFSIPVGANGEIVVPDLSVFHSMIQSREVGLAQGENEPRLVGQGAGKSLLRLFYQHWNGAGAAAAPLPMTSQNFGLQAWRYSTNETPDQWIDGHQMRISEERRYNCDLGGLWGFGCHEFVGEDTFRDVVDMGTTNELRLVTTVASGVTPSSLAVEYVLETVYLAGQS